MLSAWPWLQALPDLFHTEIFERLDPPARASLARTGRVWRETVYPLAIFPSGPPRGLDLGPVRVFKVGPGRYCAPIVRRIVSPFPELNSIL
jgi:hypothetical protein